MKPLLFEMSYRLFKGPKERESRPIMGSIVGIALSMIPLVVVIFLSDGMIKGITERYIETGTFHIQLRPYESFTNEEWDQTIKTLEEVEGVKSVSREHSGMGLAYFGHEQSAVNVRGISDSLYESDSGFRKYIEMIDGSFDLSDPFSTVIGRETAAVLGLKAGDSIKVLTGKTLSTGKYIPKVSTFHIAGVFTTGYQDLDKMWIFVPIETGLRILQDSESRTILALKSDDAYGDINGVISRIRNDLSGARWGIYSWMSLNRSQQSNYQTTKLLLILIMVLIVLVAVMNIASSMIMLVMENEQEIGILKGMGMNNRFLSLQYVLTAGLAGGSGSVLGIAAGSLIVLRFNQIIAFLDSILNLFISFWYSMRGMVHSYSVSLLNSEYYLDEVSINLDLNILLAIFFSTLLLSMAAALIPVRNIGKITALDILRKH